MSEQDLAQVVMDRCDALGAISEESGRLTRRFATPALGQAVEAVAEWARAAGMQEAFLEVRPSNSAAIRLYQSAGFEPVGVRRGYYQATTGREDASVLRRVLGA